MEGASPRITTTDTRLHIIWTCNGFAYRAMGKYMERPQRMPGEAPSKPPSMAVRALPPFMPVGPRNSGGMRHGVPDVLGDWQGRQHSSPKSERLSLGRQDGRLRRN